MKNTRNPVRLFSLILTLMLLLGSLPAFAAEQGTAYHYRHDPRLNAKAMADVVVDPSAVYGFSPDPNGGLASYAKYDWTDPDAVASYRQARLDYFASYAQMYDLLDEMSAAGASTEEIARSVSAKRNELRFVSCDGDPDALAALKTSNLERYGHEEGPLADELYAKYGSWNGVLEKAFAHNAGMDACVGLYDDCYEFYLAFGYVTDESKTLATREYTIAVLAEAAGVDGAGTLDGFADAPDVSAQYAQSVGRAAAAGVVKGCGDGTLRPQDAVTRAEALVLLSRCLPEQKTLREAAAFSDVPAWAKADVDRLSAAALVPGSGVLGAAEALTVEQVNLLAVRASGKSLLGAMEEANRPEQVFRRHSTVYRHEDVFFRGEVSFTDDLYGAADHAIYFFGEDYSRYMAPDNYIEYFSDTGELDMLLKTPREYAEDLRTNEAYLSFTPYETAQSVREQDGELLVATMNTDADTIRDHLNVQRDALGDIFAAEYVDGAAFLWVYHVDAESLEMKQLVETLRMPDGSEYPVMTVTFAYDAGVPDPTAPDSGFAPAFDETAARRQITVVFFPGTGEEQTCRYSVPEGVGAYPCYYGETLALYEDAACTQPFAGRNGRMEMTLYAIVGE